MANRTGGHNWCTSTCRLTRCMTLACTPTRRLFGGYHARHYVNGLVVGYDHRSGAGPGEGLMTKHASKEVNLMPGNRRIEVWDSFAVWVPYQTSQ